MTQPQCLRSMMGTWRRQVVFADFLAAGSIAVVTSVLALVIEDAIPLKGTPTLNLWRGLTLVGAGILLWAAIRHRNTVYRNTGTLFYVRTLSFGMRDWHANAVELARKHRMSLRSVTPWANLSPSANGVVDLVDTCAATSASLNTLLNTDRDDTGYTIAPNMVWPVALRIGCELPTISGLQLLDLDGPGAAIGNEPPGVPWTLPEGPPEPGVVERVLTTTHHTIDAPPPGATRVGLMLAFTQHAPDIDRHGTFGSFGASEYYLIRSHNIYPNLSNLVNVKYDAGQFERLAQVLPQEVARIKRLVGDREVVVIACLAKTLALALGWGLGQVSCDFFPRTHLALFNGVGKPFLPARVHSLQPLTNPMQVR